MALQKDESFHTSLLESTGDHPFGLCMKAAFSEMMAELDQSVLAVLQKYTIADLADQSLV